MSNARPPAPRRSSSTLQRAHAAQPPWHDVPLPERAAIIERFGASSSARATVATEITWQMGRPIRHAPERGTRLLERARYMLGIAARRLPRCDPATSRAFGAQIKRVPLGVVVVVAPGITRI